MFSWFKKYFIPHEGNNHRPHFLRNQNIRNVVVIVLFLELFTYFIPTFNYVNNFGTGNMAAVLPAVLSTLTNEERVTQQLPTLSVNPLLTEAAEMKANDMATKGYFAHTSPEGKTPWYWIIQAGYDFQYAGENLAINFSDSEDVTNAWMASPTHRANIVKGQYTEMGTGTATGMYQGRETVFVAQLYASPNKIIPAPVEKVNPNPSSKKIVPVVSNIKKSPVVLGAETEKITPTETAITTTPTATKTVTPAQAPTLMQKLLASPHNTSNKILWIIFGIIMIALLLNIFIKIKHHHPDLVTNGLITLAIIGAILIANNFISKRNMVILPSVDYSNIQK